MNYVVSDNLPPTMNPVFLDGFDEAQTLGLEPKILSALLIAPRVSDHFAEAIIGQRLDTLREALRTNATKIMRLLSRLSFLLFLEYLARLRSANQPWQKTRWRIVLYGSLSPTVAKVVDSCGLVFTTRFKSTQKLTTLDGKSTVIKALLAEMIQHDPVRFDPRAGTQAYYWRREVIHPYLCPFK